ncbi:MAG: hypothetical protein Q8Q42_01370 [Nanoarchaeota archaeon]|nr:hypothetical protein [Nanoarchaeota archaeon]
MTDYSGRDTDPLPVNRIGGFMEDARDISIFLDKKFHRNICLARDKALGYFSDELEDIGRDVASVLDSVKIEDDPESLFKELGSLDRRLIMIGGCLLRIGGDTAHNLFDEVNCYMDELRGCYADVLNTISGARDVLRGLIYKN